MTDTEREMKRAAMRVAVLEIRSVSVRREVRLLKEQTTADTPKR